MSSIFQGHLQSDERTTIWQLPVSAMHDKSPSQFSYSGAHSRRPSSTNTFPRARSPCACYASHRMARICPLRMFSYTWSVHSINRRTLHKFLVHPANHLGVLVDPFVGVSSTLYDIRTRYLDGWQCTGGVSKLRASHELANFRAPFGGGFLTEVRILGSDTFLAHRAYIRENPVRGGAGDLAEQWKYSSAYPGNAVGREAVPQRLKPGPVFRSGRHD